MMAEDQVNHLAKEAKGDGWGRAVSHVHGHFGQGG
jgi:hypothetical protein